MISSYQVDNLDFFFLNHTFLQVRLTAAMELLPVKIPRPTLFKIIQYIVLEWPLLQKITKILL